MNKKEIISVQGTEIMPSAHKKNYISLTDIAKRRGDGSCYFALDEYPLHDSIYGYVGTDGQPRF
jgi:hypothetical protein